MVKRRRPTSGPRAPTINDVAVRAGVSVATVSRALRGFENVSESTSAKVRRAADDLAYHIDRRASRLATGRHETVGLVVPRIDTWYFSTVLAGVESVLGPIDDLLLVCVDDVETRTQLIAGSAPLSKRVDGLVFVDILLDADEVDELDRSGLHVVTIGQRTSEFSSVTIDNRGAARAITEHLIGLGHRDMAQISGALTDGLPYSVPVERRDGFVEAQRAAGNAITPGLLVDADVTIESGARAMAQLLDGGESFTALVAGADEIACGAVAEARRRGIDVPGALSVVGFDDHPMASVTGLTTARQDPHAQGSAGAALFLALVADSGAGSQHVVEATSLVIRDSSGPVG